MDHLLNIQPIRSKPLDGIGHIFFLVIESGGESELVDDKVEFLIVSDGANDLVREESVSF